MADGFEPPGAYDYQTIHGIVNSTPVVHVSFPPDASDPFPTTLPMVGQMGSFENPSAGLNSQLDAYLHGSISARIMKLATEAIAQGEEGLPLCITATKVDGYVLALSPFHHSYNYRSAVLRGYAQPMDDDEEKLWALKLITDSVVPDRWENTRPTNKTELLSTKILRVKVYSGSAKIRVGLPGDDRADLKDETLTSRVWAGVVPTWQVYGEPISSSGSAHIEVPSHVKDFIKQENERNTVAGLEASKEPEKK